ncbi:DUF4183 domain-containing protein [Bacillus sp. FJAT-28004]|uniref:DUF4183 domain-containing protein n=1 Tax=Bacillus sp. FJAT-28004 TaxID=1679165 RepID=UPI0006B4F813|nr:DUF4183 domain-containing protein [Bacillus sp. FJAT-28004]
MVCKKNRKMAMKNKPLFNYNDGRSKECKKKTIIVCPMKRKKSRRVILKSKIYIRLKPVINVTAPRGPRGSRGPRGIRGRQGPAGPVITPLVSSMLTANRYFFIANSDIPLPTEIPANQFITDDGKSITEFAVLDQNSYANLYINGIMQEGSSYSISTSALNIIANQGTLFAGTSIIIETVRLSVQLIPKNDAM